MHSFRRIGLIGSAWVTVALAFGVGAGRAQEVPYPTKPIRLVFPYSAGGMTDELARRVADGMGKRLGQPVVVEYRPGASTIIGAANVAKALPDGYTLLYGSATTFSVNVSTHRSLPYDALKDFTGISRTSIAPFYMLASPSLPVSNLREFIDYARKRPGELSYATAGVGSVPHLTIEHFSQLAGIKMVHVPYKAGNESLLALQAGHIQFAINSAGLESIRSGRLKGLAVTSAQRLDNAPEIPTVGEAAIPGYASDVWFGIAAPAGTPAAIVSKLNTAVRETLAEPELKKRFSDQGIVLSANSPEEMNKQIRDEIPIWRDVIRQAGIEAID